MRPRILDLFCKAGGASMGYSRAGFDVVGVDIEPQPRYPFAFHQEDAIDFCRRNGREFDAIHASPPCQKFCRLRGLLEYQGRARTYVDLIPATRQAVRSTGRLYVIENVEGAPLLCSIVLCGSMFGLDVQRHRIFETSFGILAPECRHGIWKRDKPPLHRSRGKSRVVGCYGRGGRGKGDTVGLWRDAMGIDWMTRSELSQAIPPAYTEYIGRRIARVLGKRLADE
jgi:hypothetical protein